MPLIITCDHKWKPFRYRNEVPAAVLASEFDYLKEDDGEGLDGFFRYCGVWYHTSQFERVAPGLFPGEWHGSSPDSFFSGVLLRLSDDGEEYQVGRYCS